MIASLADQPLLTILAAKEVWRRTRRRLRTGPLTRWRFAGSAPAQLLVVPPNLRRGDSVMAEALYSGRFHLAGLLVETGRGSIFEAPLPSLAFAAELHSFEWLRHHSEAGDALSAQNARSLVDDWIRSKGGAVGDVAFSPQPAARRVIAWMTHADLLLTDADHGFYRRFMKSLAAQARYLRSIALEAPDGLPRLTVRTALALVSLCLPVAGARAKAAADNLSAELDRQIFPDGGHFSRDPLAALAILPELIALRETHLGEGKALPKGLYSAIDRMLPTLRFFRHSDGTFALFNGSGLADNRLASTLMRFDETLGNPIVHARQSGYHRLTAGQTVVIADTGCPPPIAVAGNAHAGTLSFELSSEASRIVVNCGRPSNDDVDWRRLSRATAAHSTVTIDDRSSSRFARSAHLDRFLGTPLVPGPTQVTSLDPSGEGLGFEAVHDGYERSFGLMHRRRVIVSSGGRHVEGFDRLEWAAGARGQRQEAPSRATARFHLHPSVVVESAGEEIRLSVRGQTWLFTAGGPIDVEDSVFFADSAGARRTQQLVVTFAANDSLGLGWHFSRLS